jgi:hypothetical protein
MVSNSKFKSILNFQKHYFEIMFPLFENSVLLSAGFSHSSPISRRDCPVIHSFPLREAHCSLPHQQQRWPPDWLQNVGAWRMLQYPPISSSRNKELLTPRGWEDCQKTPLSQQRALGIIHAEEKCHTKVHGSPQEQPASYD